MIKLFAYEKTIIEVVSSVEAKVSQVIYTSVEYNFNNMIRRPDLDITVKE